MPVDLQIVLSLLKTSQLVEKSVALFYEACAATWPKEKLFWQQLAKSEYDHIKNLAKMADLVTRKC